MALANMPRLLIAAPASGAGKTTLTCGLLRAFLDRGLRVQAFKSGPDYIDPMFHREVIGAPSGNLDLFLLGGETVRALLAKREGSADIAVIESAMGYYDGVAATDTASGYALARETETPAVLVVDGRKAALSLAATVQGFAGFRPDANVRGVILNHIPARLFELLAPAIAGETGIPVLGHLPDLPDCALESRHLGLVTAEEVGDLRGKMARLAAQLAQTVDLDALLAIARSAPPLAYAPPETRRAFDGLPIAIARDAAFCFVYADALELLEAMGARLLPFSPLADAALPKEACGLLLPGGYPELHARTLSENASMRRSIREALAAGMPCVAECGGFLYLHGTLEDARGAEYPMVGFLPGHGRKGTRLQRFGYVTLTAAEDGLLLRAGESIPAHEFHYWQSDSPGDAFTAQKPLRSDAWTCVHASPNLFAGFPHFHFCAKPEAAYRFLSRCKEVGQC